MTAIRVAKINTVTMREWITSRVPVKIWQYHRMAASALLK